jgi:CubicO group peptidase (beta-lactamase class C family)
MMRRTTSSLAARLAPSAFALALMAGCSEPGPPPLPPLPDGALEAVSVEPGVPREALARAVDELFTREGIGETRALVVMHEGEIVAERYGEGFTAETPMVGWSMSKTVTGVLIGMMVADGRLALDESPPIDHWQRAGDPRGEITLRQLLQMRSGLRHEEKAEPLYTSPEVRMMYLDGRNDMASWAEAQPLDHEPGSRHQYSTATSVILGDIMARLLAPDGGPSARQEAMAHYLDARLATPLGMESLVAEYDAAGTMVAGSQVWATARDWARFGEFLRRGGTAGGAQIVPHRWIDFMRTPSPRAPDYGAHLWLNRPSDNGRDVLFAAQGPDDLFAAVGHLGQYVLVSPGQRLTVVRLGQTNEEDRDALVDALAELVQLYPRRSSAAVR